MYQGRYFAVCALAPLLCCSRRSLRSSVTPCNDGRIILADKGVNVFEFGWHAKPSVSRRSPAGRRRKSRSARSIAGVRRDSLRSKVAASKLSTQTGLEITLERQRLAHVSKGHTGFDAPRAVFCSMRAGATIVMLQAVIEIVGNTRVMSVWIMLADKGIDVFEFGWHAKP